MEKQMNRRFLKLTLLAGLISFGLAGCGSSNSQDEEIPQEHQTAPSLKVKPQGNYAKDDGSLDVKKYNQTQTKYIKSNE